VQRALLLKPPLLLLLKKKKQKSPDEVSRNNTDISMSLTGRRQQWRAMACKLLTAAHS
jgi:hypothetical protein